MRQLTVIMGITGGIAAVKIPELILYLKKHNIRIIPIMTESACRIVDKHIIETASEENVFTSLFSNDFSIERVLQTRTVDHIDVADRADLAVIVPATANIIGKLAQGIADDFLTTTMLATTAPIMVCPSMNVHMWENRIVQDNLKKLRDYGYIILPPESGMLACGYEGMGRLPDTEVIGSEIVSMLTRENLLKGKKVLVTAGGTIENIDSIRHITNRSSGKMGAAIADACHEFGGEVILLKAKSAVFPRYPIENYIFETAEELSFLIKKYVKDCDICFHAAAVSDFTATFRQGKISSSRKTQITLTPRKKVYKNIKKIHPSIFLVTFKAEWRLTEHKLLRKIKQNISTEDMDVIIANDVGKKGRGFETDTNEVLVMKKDGTYKNFPLTSKRIVAREVVKYLFPMRSKS